MLCSVCGREIPEGQAASYTFLGETWPLCHRDDENPTCYMRVIWLHPGGEAKVVTAR
jgi:hypothetical protein